MKNKKNECALLLYSFFATSFTNVFFSADDARNFKISSFCCWVNVIGSPLIAIIIKHFEEFFFNDIALACLFYQLMFQAEFNYFILFVVIIHHLSFTSLRQESHPLIMLLVANEHI